MIELAVHKQPLKALYLGYHFFVLALFKLPFWALMYLFPRARPSPRWSARLALTVRLCRWWGTVGIRSGLFSVFARDLTKLVSDDDLVKAGDECRFVWLPDLDVDHDLVGEVAEWSRRNGTRPAKVPAYWWGERTPTGTAGHPARHGEKVVLHFHGGGYVYGSAHPGDPVSNLVRGLLKHALRQPKPPFKRILSVEYRCCRAEPHSEPANPFPCQLMDGLAGYIYLVRHVGFAPQNIVLSGDSAGGNLAHALARYLRDAQIGDLVASPELVIGPIGGLMMQSPWLDMLPTHQDAGPKSSFVRNRKTDIIARDTPSAVSVYGLKGFRGVSITDDDVATNAYFSPGSLCVGQTGPRRAAAGQNGNGCVDIDIDVDIDEHGSSKPEPGQEREAGMAGRGDKERTLFGGYPRTYFSTGRLELLNDEIHLAASLIAKDNPSRRRMGVSGRSSALKEEEEGSPPRENGGAPLGRAEMNMNGRAVARSASTPATDLTRSPGPPSPNGDGGLKDLERVVVEDDCDRGAWVTVSEEPEMFHDFCVFSICEPARGRELERMVAWVGSL